MILNIRDLPASGGRYENDTQSLAFSCDLDLSGIRRLGENIFPNPVRAEGRICRTHGEVTLDYTASYELCAACARCLEPVVQNETLKFHHIVAEQPDKSFPERITACGGMLDLRELAGGDLLLSLNGVTLCSQDCKGLCPRCGCNLNHDACGCLAGAKPADPRFSALLELL